MIETARRPFSRAKSVDMRELQYVVAHLSLVSHVNHPVVRFDFENAKIMINLHHAKR